MSSEYTVTWTATFNTTVKLAPGQTLENAIENIDIPEDADTSYNCGSFEVIEAADYDQKRIPASRYEKVTGSVEDYRPAVTEAITAFLNDREDNPGDPPSYEGLADELRDLVPDKDSARAYHRLCEHFRIHDVSLAGVDGVIARLFE